MGIPQLVRGEPACNRILRGLLKTGVYPPVEDAGLGGEIEIDSIGCLQDALETC